MEKCFRCNLPENKCTCEKWKIEVPYVVTAYMIDCILDSAMYVCEFWCGCACLDPPFVPGTGLCFSEMLTRGHDVIMEDDDRVAYRLTIEKMLKDIQMFVAQRGVLALEDVDAEAADCIIQYALFGESDHFGDIIKLSTFRYQASTDKAAVQSTRVVKVLESKNIPWLAHFQMVNKKEYMEGTLIKEE